MKYFLLLPLTLLCVTALGAPPSFAGWMETYYLEKHDPRELAEYWDRTVGRRGFETLPEQAKDTIMGFFGAALRGKADLIKSRITSLDQFPEKERDAISMILWYSDLEYSREVLRKAGQKEAASSPCPPIQNREILSQGDANFMVGWFYATGDQAVLQPIITYIVKADWTISDTKADECGGALVFLCRQHAIVRALVEEVLKRPDLSKEARNVLHISLGGQSAPAVTTPAPISK